MCMYSDLYTLLSQFMLLLWGDPFPWTRWIDQWQAIAFENCKKENKHSLSLKSRPLDLSLEGKKWNHLHHKRAEKVEFRLCSCPLRMDLCVAIRPQWHVAHRGSAQHGSVHPGPAMLGFIQEHCTFFRFFSFFYGFGLMHLGAFYVLLLLHFKGNCYVF